MAMKLHTILTSFKHQANRCLALLFAALICPPLHSSCCYLFPFLPPCVIAPFPTTALPQPANKHTHTPAHRVPPFLPVCA